METEIRSTQVPRERRGIPFELTFKQWLKIWQDSGICANADTGKAVRHGPVFRRGVLQDRKRADYPAEDTIIWCLRMREH